MEPPTHQKTANGIYHFNQLPEPALFLGKFAGAKSRQSGNRSEKSDSEAFRLYEIFKNSAEIDYKCLYPLNFAARNLWRFLRRPLPY
jgi:hypothetical protein